MISVYNQVVFDEALQLYTLAKGIEESLHGGLKSVKEYHLSNRARVKRIKHKRKKKRK